MDDASPSRRASGAILLALAALIVSCRLYTAREPVECDLTTYAVFGHEMLHGRTLYRDVWNNYTPAIFLSYAGAEMVVGYGQRQFLFLGLATALVTLAGVYRAASLGPGGRSAGLWAAAFWAVVCSDADLQANQPNTESFVNACSAWAFAACLRPRGVAAAWAGVLAGLVFWYKPVCVSIPLAVAATAALADALADPGNARRPVGRFALTGLAAAACVAAGFAAVAASGVLSDFLGAVVQFNRYYAGNPPWNLARSLAPWRAFPLPMRAAAPLLVLSAWFLLARTPPGATRPRAALLGYFLGTQVAVAATGRFFDHYYQLWLPGAAVGAAWGVAAVSRPALRRAAGVVALALLAGYEARYYRLSPDDWSRRKYGERFVAGRRVAGRLAAALGPTGRFYVLGNETGLYLSTGKRPPANPAWAEHLAYGPVAAGVRDRTLAELRADPPEMVVACGDSLEMLAEGDPLKAWLGANYRPLPPDADAPPYDRLYFHLYARRPL